MEKIIIVLLLIIDISTKTANVSENVEFDVRTFIDEDHHKFTFNQSQEMGFFFLDIYTNQSLKYEYQCQGTENVTRHPLFHSGLIIKANKGQCWINFFVPSDYFTLEGYFLVHPLEKEMVINIKEKYDFFYPVLSYYKEKFPPLVFSLSNLDGNYWGYFSCYKGRIFDYDDDIIAKNPYRICKGNDCEDGVENFLFSTGNEYKIEIKPQEIEKDGQKLYVFNSFKFYFELQGNYLLNNHLIYLIIILLLLF